MPVCGKLTLPDIYSFLHSSAGRTEKLTKCVILSPLFINGQNLSGTKRENQVLVADSNSFRVAGRKSVRHSVTIC